MEDKVVDFGNRDTCLLASLTYYACEDTANEIKASSALYYNCRVNRLFGQRKHPSYRWSNSEGFTKKIYDKFLKYLKIDPYKGLNFDQLRAYWLLDYAYGVHNSAAKHLLGFILRLGFAPSLMENILFKPQSTVLLLAKLWKPLRFLVYPFFLPMAYYELKFVPIEKSTTNKITLIPTLKELGFSLTTDEFNDKVYDTYFKKDQPLLCEMLKKKLRS